MDINRVLANNVKWFRKSLGFTQEGLAELAGLHRTYIGLIEQGEGNPSTNAIGKIAGALRIPPAFLLFEIESGDQARELLSTTLPSKRSKRRPSTPASRDDHTFFLIERKDVDLTWAPLKRQNKDQIISMLFSLVAPNPDTERQRSDTDDAFARKVDRYTDSSLRYYIQSFESDEADEG